MFTGAIEQNVRSFIAANADRFVGQTIVVGCSGNFTSEKVLIGASAPAAVYSNDVSLYSLVLADAMLDRRTDGVQVRAPDEYPFVHPWLEQGDLWFRAGAIMVFMSALEFVQQKNTFQRIQWQRYVANFESLVATTSLNLTESAVQIADYWSGDCFEHYQRHDAGEGTKDGPIFFGFLPTYRGGYERIYKRLNERVDWPEPKYPMIDDESRAEVHAWLAARRHLFITDHEVEGMKPVVVSARANHKTVYIYSNVVDRTALFRKPITDSGTRFEMIPPDYQFTAKTAIDVVAIRAVDIAYYKAAFLNPDIDFVVGMYGFALLADGGLFGFCEFSPGKYDGSFFYMMADFPIEPKPHERTSKLVVMIAKSATVRDILEARKLERTTGITTTAWTARPVSMKYRGVLTKANRGETEDGRKFINYQSDWSPLTAQEMYTEWRKRHKVQ